MVPERTGVLIASRRQIISGMLDMKRIILAGLLGLASFHAAEAADAPLEKMKVERHDVARERLFEGVVEAVRESTVSAQTSGRILAINFDVNDRVKEGDILVVLDDTQQKAQLEQAIAAVRAAEARLQAAKQDFARVSRLFRQGTVAKARYDQSKAELDSAKAGLKQALAARKQAEEQLAYTRVRAPYSGIVTARHVQVGELAAPGKPLMTGFSLEELRAHVELPQRYVPVVRKKKKASVVLDLDGRERLKVSRMTIFPYSNPKTNTVTVRLYLADKGRDLFPGMLVKGAFEIEKAAVLAIPETAVARRGELSGVYVFVDDGRILFQQVRTGRPVGKGMVEVLSGLEEGDVIALDPLQAAIHLKEAEAKQAAAATETGEH